jgi:hypothetical protein
MRHRSERRGAGPTLVLCTAVLVGLTACGTASSAAPRAGSPSKHENVQRGSLSATTTPSPVAAPKTAPGSNHHMFAFYYLWWDTAHWHARLGPNYPYTAKTLPLPATLSGNGCVVTSDFRGNQLTDVASPLFTQDSSAQIARDVYLAAGSGLAGFAVAWAGTGQRHQTVSSSAFNRRLALLVSTVHAINRAGVPFSLWIAYMSSAKIRTETQINNDLTYLQTMYGSDSAFDHSNAGRPTLVLMGSRKYPISVLNAVSARWRPHFYLVGDENWNTWSNAKAADFDADQYYWSSQNPIRNPASFKDISRLAAEVRSTRNPDGSVKQFFSPLAPGYNKVLGGGSGCVPRDDGQTMRQLYSGNAQSNPDGWMVISWNEIDEGTYILPLERYGTQSLLVLRSIIDGPTSESAG